MLTEFALRLGLAALAGLVVLSIHWAGAIFERMARRRRRPPQVRR